MYIDCQTCPGRPVACDGCMIQALFEPLSSGNAVSEGGGKVTEQGPVGDVEIDSAIDVFVSAAMVSSAAALSARSGKTSVQAHKSARQLKILRAG
ncbi:hypothetical protein [Gordonia rhizosphera]|uniref:hypothetical protein n=1 Tax=Gordonia rhizosphera TaxID=83341 RepID=UPI000A02062F|nr:hypothetical protein [Gordonia rhizosphera]